MGQVFSQGLQVPLMFARDDSAWESLAMTHKWGCEHLRAPQSDEMPRASSCFEGGGHHSVEMVSGVSRVWSPFFLYNE